MSPQQRNERARRYIDDIMEINRKYDMAGPMSPGAYDAAVRQAQRAFAGLDRSGTREGDEQMLDQTDGNV